jgi:flagellar biosynthesis protein FlhG
VKPIADQDHYEALDVSPSATRDEIERAYHLAKATYADDSLAGYSVFQEGELPLMRERLENAYRTLSDQDARRAYDEELARPAREIYADSEAPEPFELPTAVDVPPTVLPPPITLARDPDGDEGEEEQGAYDGARLERVRVRRGIELDEIAGITKVNPAYLRFIEEERFDDLPAAVYVRGFVKCYARCLGLDPDRVARSYMQRYEERPSKRRRGLFSRRPVTPAR